MAERKERRGGVRRERRREGKKRGGEGKRRGGRREGRKRGGEVKTAKEEGRGVRSSSEWQKTVVCTLKGNLGYSPALCSPS